MGKFDKEEIISNFKSLKLKEHTPKEGNQITDLRNKFQPIHTFLFILKGIDDGEIDPNEFQTLIRDMRRDAIEMNEIFGSMLHELGNE